MTEFLILNWLPSTCWYFDNYDLLEGAVDLHLVAIVWNMVEAINAFFALRS